MRILNVIDLMNPVSGGGSTERIYQMSRYLALAGVQVDILTTKWDLDLEYVSKLKGVNYYFVDAFHCRYLFPRGVKKWLQQNIAKYDVINLSKNWSILVHIAAKVAASQNIPFVFSSMGFVEVHNRSRVLKRMFRKYSTIPLIKKTSACIAVTNEEKDDLINAGVLPDNVHLIPNGIVPEDFLYKDNDGFRRKHKLDNRKIMLVISRTDPIKGISLLIDAFERDRARLSDWLLLFVGTQTPYRLKMKRKVQNLNLQNSILFLDPLFGKEKSEAYHASEFVAVPSLKDAMTIIAPEAACCAKPVLITNTSGFRELAQCGGALEVDPSVEGLSYGLNKLINDCCNRTLMGKNGYEYVMQNFQWERVVLKYQDLFQKVMQSSV